MEETQLKEKPTTCRSIPPESRGLLLSFISGLILSCIALIVKHLDGIHPGQLVVYRFSATTCICFPQLVFTGQNIFGPPGYRIWIIIRGLTTSTFVFFQYLAFRYLPVGEAAVLISCYPVFVSLAAKILLKENFGLLQLISLVCAIFGIVLTTGLFQVLIQKSRVYTTDDIYGTLSAIASVLFLTANYILTRKMKHIDSSVFQFITGCVGTVEIGIITAFTGNFSLHCKSFQLILIILLGCLSYLGITSLILAVRYAETGPAATVRATTDIFFSFVYQVVIFAKIPDGISIAGVILLAISITSVGFRKQLNNFFRDRGLNFF